MKSAPYLIVIISLITFFNSLAQSVEFAEPPLMKLPQKDFIDGYKIKYKAKKKGHIYLVLYKNGSPIGNSVIPVKKGSGIIETSIAIWDGKKVLTSGNKYSYFIKMHAAPYHIFENLVAESPIVKGVKVAGVDTKYIKKVYKL